MAACSGSAVWRAALAAALLACLAARAAAMPTVWQSPPPPGKATAQSAAQLAQAKAGKHQR